jgi:ferritin-like metal-binding protein YciE
VFEEIGARRQGKTCDAIMGILEEGKEIMSKYKRAPALDAGMLAVAQAVEHYEMSRYGSLIAWADKLGFSKASDLLGKHWPRKRTPTKLSHASPRASSTPKRKRLDSSAGRASSRHVGKRFIQKAG